MKPPDPPPARARRTTPLPPRKHVRVGFRIQDQANDAGAQEVRGNRVSFRRSAELPPLLSRQAVRQPALTAGPGVTPGPGLEQREKLVLRNRDRGPGPADGWNSTNFFRPPFLPLAAAPPPPVPFHSLCLQSVQEKALGTIVRRKQGEGEGKISKKLVGGALELQGCASFWVFFLLSSRQAVVCHIGIVRCFARQHHNCASVAFISILSGSR